MSERNEDPAVVGVPPETPESVRRSATGLVVGPVDAETNVVADSDPSDEEATQAAGGEVVGETTDGSPLIEGPNSY